MKHRKVINGLILALLTLTPLMAGIEVDEGKIENAPVSVGEALAWSANMEEKTDVDRSKLLLSELRGQVADSSGARWDIDLREGKNVYRILIRPDGVSGYTYEISQTLSDVDTGKTYPELETAWKDDLVAMAKKRLEEDGEKLTGGVLIKLDLRGSGKSKGDVIWQITYAIDSKDSEKNLGKQVVYRNGKFAAVGEATIF